MRWIGEVNTMGWFNAKNNAEMDTTIRLIGGLLLFGILIIGFFIGDIFYEKNFLTPELAHALVTTVGMWVMYHQGKKEGMRNGNESEHPDTKQHRIY